MEERLYLLQAFLEDLHGLDVPKGYESDINDLIWNVKDEMNEIEPKLVEENEQNKRADIESWRRDVL